MKKAIVIGATSGIGYNLAGYMAADGYDVGIVGRRIKALEQLKATNPNKFVPLCLDVAQTVTVHNALESLIEQLGGLDVLVYCSGAGEPNMELDFDTEMISVDVNVVGFTAVVDFAYNFFKQQGSGKLVVISSVAGLRGDAIAPAYSASKAYQINYLEGLRQRAHLEKSGVKIMDIRPGFVDTAMMKGDGHFWVTSPQQAASRIHGAINGFCSVVYVSRRWCLVAFVLKMLPRKLYNRFGRLPK